MWVSSVSISVKYRSRPAVSMPFARTVARIASICARTVASSPSAMLRIAAVRAATIACRLSSFASVSLTALISWMIFRISSSASCFAETLAAISSSISSPMISFSASVAWSRRVSDEMSGTASVSRNSFGTAFFIGR
jgi:hypothetical protein